MRYLRREVQARKQAVSVTKLATSVASIKIPRRSLTVVCYCSSSAFRNYWPRNFVPLRRDGCTQACDRV
jgi:uncharacterized Zn-finger protein